MPEPYDVLELTSEIVAAFVGKNSVRPAELPELIAAVHGSLTRLGAPPAVEEPAPELKPAVPVRKSVTPDYLVSLEDGKRYQTLKRHLSIRGMTPDDYRAKWGLPKDYPMVAPSYAAKRSKLALAAGLGSRRQFDVELASHTALTPVEPEPATLAPVVVEAAAEQPVPKQPVGDETAPKRRGRPRKTAAEQPAPMGEVPAEG